ncbi:MAG: methyltransferase domain-containing protein [Methylocystaceae bacterium]|nr:methyltransferase domain-containing protein [Methylocystaceae bacterium]
MNKSHIKQTFGKASKTYDREAPVQQWAAELLIGYIEGLNLKSVGHCLEIGCGTGFLSEKVYRLFPAADWLITDLSAEMLDQCKARFPVGKNITFQVMDGEKPTVHEHYDLIVSSLAFQWFYDLSGSLHHLSELLNPEGRLIFTTLGPDTFIEWRQLFEAYEQPVGLHRYPSVSELNSYVFDGCRVDFTSHHKTQNYRDGFAFLKALKTIGAQVPQSGYRPLSAGALRKMLKALGSDEQGCTMTYEILLGEIVREKDK